MAQATWLCSVHLVDQGDSSHKQQNGECQQLAVHLLLFPRTFRRLSRAALRPKSIAAWAVVFITSLAVERTRYGLRCSESGQDPSGQRGIRRVTLPLS